MKSAIFILLNNFNTDRCWQELEFMAIYEAIYLCHYMHLYNVTDLFIEMEWSEMHSKLDGKNDDR